MGLFDSIKDAVRSDNDDHDHTNKIDRDEDGDISSIPEWVVEDRVNVERRTEIIHKHYSVSEAQAATIAQKLKTELESTDGFTQDEIRRKLEESLDLSSDLLETIVWTERASILTMDRISSYIEQNGPDALYKITAPDDDRTHPITREVADEVKQNGGITLAELQNLLREKAEQYEEEGGTPERMEHWVPHERFRFSIARVISDM